ncbi:palmitoyltransferase ZDHHC18a isoform X2 [Gouania willdenowi]|uniref:palmitoyltransferase ZDHHC18a isoform X2 n=1 Tax=Gouania willdenowi TaxID=441366 RepID=UPI0010565531|nr:palmitoyltransferase ZDHHC18 isoform X2 [Gouania willdenowi]
MKNCEYQQIDPRTLSVSPQSAQSLGEAKRQRPRRKWEVFPGKNRFYCDGRIILARQNGVLPLTLGLIVVTCGLFFAFDSLLRTSFTDPGILPRATTEEAADVERQIDTSGSSTYRPPPRTKEILINQQVVKLKYCFTCKMFRPPRTSHCSMCDNCVERFDHHCPWVGNCVGKRNYRFFYIFIISLSFLTSFIFGCVITHLTLRSQTGKSIIQTIQESPASVVELVICFFSIWSILGLSGFHTYLVASNLTTNEDIKGSWSSKRGAEESGNPYTYNSIITNCCATLCGPMPPSLIDRRGFVLSDEAVPVGSASRMELPPFAVKSDVNMCTPSTKDMLERMVHTSDLHCLCPPGTPKTTPLVLEVPTSAATPTEPPNSTSCSGQHSIKPAADSCALFGLGTNERDSLHSINPAFRLASPSPSLSHFALNLSDSPDLGFVPLH